MPLLSSEERSRKVRFSKALLLLALLMLLAASCGRAAVEDAPTLPATSPSEQQSTQASAPPNASETPERDVFDYSADAILAVDEIETVHPIFLIGELPENYESVRDAYLQYTASPTIKTDFLLATQRYLTVLSDGHMGGGLLEDGRFLDAKWIAVGSRLFVADKDGACTDTEVTEIGRVPVKDVMAQVDVYYFAENDAARQRQYSVYCRQEEMLTLAGCRIENNTVSLTLQQAGSASTVACKLVRTSRSSQYYGADPRYIIRHHMIDDVFYIDLRAFNDDKSVDDTADEIRKAIENGTYKFIIDVRDNGGGNSIVGRKLLAAMDMDVPSYGSYTRNSELSAKQRSGSGGLELVFNERDASTAKSNDDISLAVLTNDITFSSATMLGVWVQDGGLGTIIGQPSSNSPNAFGDMLYIRLPESGIDLPISHRQFLRPDPEADPATLHPDIFVELGDDALEIALEYLSGQ